jgi:hypothetical protein
MYDSVSVPVIKLDDLVTERRGRAVPILLSVRHESEAEWLIFDIVLI